MEFDFDECPIRLKNDLTEYSQSPVVAHANGKAFLTPCEVNDGDWYISAIILYEEHDWRLADQHLDNEVAISGDQFRDVRDWLVQDSYYSDHMQELISQYNINAIAHEGDQQNELLDAAELENTDT